MSTTRTRRWSSASSSGAANGAWRRRPCGWPASRSPEQVAELTRILDEDGYLASVEPMDDGSFRIVEHNCAILAVATKYGTACGTELEFIREVLPEADVDRVAHMMAGEHICRYEIAPRER